jgi:UDP-glucose 4-epimerase
MAKVLVIGGAGYVGSHVTKALSDQRHDVLIFDDLSTGFRQLARYGRFVEGSILKPDAFSAVVRDFHPEAVMHFAARTAVGESVLKPEEYYEVNVDGTLNVLKVLRKDAPKAKFIFSSTCAIYQESSEPLHEGVPLGPINPYGRTKKIMEEILADYSRAYDLRYVSLRYFNVAGADKDGQIGEMHEPETHLIPRLLLQAAGKQKEEVKIFGNDYPTPDGTCIRDYIHTEDLAAAHLLAMQHLLAGGLSDFFNLGSAEGYSVLEVIKMVEKVTGKALPLEVGARRPGDAVRLIANSEKIHKAFAWKPKYGLEEMVASAWKWTCRR